MDDITFRSEDNRFGLRVPNSIVQKILDCCRHAEVFETGGILGGYYNPEHDCAVVSAISTEPSDSRRGRSWFERGVNGLQRWLNGLWRRQQYYLGEWHFHPGGTSAPSNVDLSQMQRIASTKSYHCPEPVLLIIGGDPWGVWTARSMVCVAGGKTIELKQTY